MYRNFITFEGGEASGKTSIIKAVCEFLEKTNKNFIISREPGGDVISEQIRNVILNKKNVNKLFYLGIFPKNVDFVLTFAICCDIIDKNTHFLFLEK